MKGTPTKTTSFHPHLDATTNHRQSKLLRFILAIQELEYWIAGRDQPSNQSKE
jgi:hypothetical protein